MGYHTAPALPPPQIIRVGTDHTNCIPRSSLPELPSEWQIPFAYGTVNGHTGVGMECVHDANNRCMVFDCGHQRWRPIATAPKDGSLILGWDNKVMRGKGAAVVMIWARNEYTQKHEWMSFWNV